MEGVIPEVSAGGALSEEEGDGVPGFGTAAMGFGWGKGGHPGTHKGWRRRAEKRRRKATPIRRKDGEDVRLFVGPAIRPDAAARRALAFSLHADADSSIFFLCVRRDPRALSFSSDDDVDGLKKTEAVPLRSLRLLRAWLPTSPPHDFGGHEAVLFALFPEQC